MQLLLEFAKQNQNDIIGLFFLAAIILMIMFLVNFIKAIKLKKNDGLNSQFDTKIFEYEPKKFKKNATIFLITSVMFFVLALILTVREYYVNGGPYPLAMSSDEVGDNNDAGINKLAYAIQNGKSPEEIQKVIDKGEDVNLRNQHGITLLMYAAGWTDPVIIELLLKNGARIDDVDNNGDTAVFHAVQMRKPENVRYLAEHGANMNLQGKDKYTPLVAALHDWQRVAETRAKIDEELANGTSKMSQKNIRMADEEYQVVRGSIKAIINYLVKSGVDTTLADAHGHTALDLAKDTEFETLVKILSRMQNPALSGMSTDGSISNEALLNGL